MFVATTLLKSSSVEQETFNRAKIKKMLVKQVEIFLTCGSTLFCIY